MASKTNISRSDHYDGPDNPDNIVFSHYCLPNVIVADIRYDDGDNSGVIDTGYTFPDLCAIESAILFNGTGEAATIDIGVTGDADGLATGLDISGTNNAVVLSLANGAETAGDLLKETTSSGPSRILDVSSGGKNLVYQASGNLSSYVGRIFILLWDLTKNVT